MGALHFTGFYRVLIVGIMMIFTVLACGLPGSNSPMLVTVVVTTTPGSGWLDQSGIPVTGGQTPSVTPIPNTNSPITIVVHQSQPGIITKSGPVIQDSNSSITASQHHPQGGDHFEINLFERPFSPNTQEVYFPQIDILLTSMIKGSPWTYGSITLDGLDPVSNSLNGSYALELDTNMDGRGDILLVANHPTQGDWSTDGVQVFVNSNNQVGGSLPIQSDHSPQGTGFNQKIFDGGHGSDPDLAWAKVNPGQPNVVWLAFKISLIGGTGQWMWGAWAQMGSLHPDLFDYNDHFSAEQAGSPLPNNPDYPLDALAEVDNTCRWPVGFTPTGHEPGLCSLSPTPAPSASWTSTLAATATQVPSITSTHPMELTLIIPTFKLPPILLETSTPTKIPIIKINPNLVVPSLP